MSEKKNFVLRIDANTYKALEKWAADEFRSVNGQIEWILDKALKDFGRRPDMEGGKNPGKKNPKQS